MATVTQVCEGLATNLSTIDGVQVSAWMLSSPTPPAIHVIPPAIEYHQAMQDGFNELTFTVQAFVALGTDIGTQKRLAQLRAPTGSSSIKAAIEADRTLGGVVKDLIVRSSSEPEVFVQAERQMLVSDFTVTVYD